VEIRDTLQEFLAGVIQLPRQWSLRWRPASSIVRAFREAGATSPRTAQRYHAHSALDESAFESLLADGIIRQRSPGRYYLDETTLRRLVLDPDS
jgi:hypothetical protein